MKAIILLATLKKTGLSNTQTLCEFLGTHFTEQEIDYEIVRLVDHVVLPGTYHDMGAGDQWPAIFQKVKAADVIIFATPIWWGGHSSEMQRVIERLDKVHDEILAGQGSSLEGKPAGIVITGDSDGAQHVIGNIANFFNAIGLLFPPYATLSVLAEEQEKESGTSKEALLKKYEQEYNKMAATMVKQLKKYATAAQ